MKFKCPYCESIITISYSYLGITIECPQCLKTSKCDHSNIVRMELTGYGVTYYTFIQLLQSEDLRNKFHYKIESWYDCKIVNQNGMVLFYKNTTDLILPMEIHLAIQNHKRRQKDLYQMAMSIMR